MHHPIRNTLLYHSTIRRVERLDLLVTHLGADSTKGEQEIASTRKAHAKFSFMKEAYKGHLTATFIYSSKERLVNYH